MSLTASERLTTTALRLFQERGLSRVGISEIIEQADVARMSLYNNFGSKEELALAAYAELSKQRQHAMDARIAAAATPRAAILSLFDMAVEFAANPAFKGCAFINLAAHTAVEDERLVALVRQHKATLRTRFSLLAKRHGKRRSTLVGRQLLALWDGALVDAFIEGDANAIKAARTAANRLLKDND